MRSHPCGRTDEACGRNRRWRFRSRSPQALLRSPSCREFAGTPHCSPRSWAPAPCSPSGTPRCSCCICAGAAFSRWRSSCGSSTTCRPARRARCCLYWGWYWRQVYDSAPPHRWRSCSSRTPSTCCSAGRGATPTRSGFGPFPVIFSINLFLWFKPDWFYLQFLMVALGFAAKELIRWDKDGRPAHIFNPSSFPLAVFSLGLLPTGTSDITWGTDIANTQFYPPHMYLMLFLVGLPGQFFFGVTSMTMSAVVTTYLFGLLYFAATGIYFFYDSYIPIAVFLGMHLLFTDPSTSPRTELGRIIFGTLYGLSTVALYAPARQRGNADLLRQAPAGAAPEPLDQADRSRRAIQGAPGARSRRARPIAGAAPAQPGVHVASGRSCSRS